MSPFISTMKLQKGSLFISPAHPLSRLSAVNHAALLPLSLLYALQYTLLRFLGGASLRISALTRSTWVARLRLTWSFTLGNITARRFASRRRSLVAASVGGTRHCQRTFTKEKERKRKRDERSFHVLAQSCHDVRTRLRRSLFLSPVTASAYRDKDIASISRYAMMV